MQAPSAAGRKLDAVFPSAMPDAGINDELQPGVVTTALSLWREHPHLPAIELLDRTMRIHAGEELDFQFDGEIELAAPHPFAELVRQAFAPHLDATELCLAFLDMRIADDDLRRRLSRARRCWNKALMLFARRYRIWEP